MPAACYTPDSMADVRPFRGLRFTPSAAPDLGSVLCPPYDVIDASDDRRLRDRHPYNVVRLELTTASVAGGPEGRYDEAAGTLRDWRDAGVLVRDDVPAYYLHEATFPHAGGHATRREIVAAVRLEPWDRGAVLPHERTYPRAKADRLRLLAATETNLSPILVFFQRDRRRDGQSGGRGGRGLGLDGASRARMGLAPTLTASITASGCSRITTSSRGCAPTSRSRPLFIADGHHRYETALNYLEDRRSAGRRRPASRAPGPLRDDAPDRRRRPRPGDPAAAPPGKAAPHRMPCRRWSSAWAATSTVELRELRAPPR